MLQDAHSRKIAEDIQAPVGDTTIIAAATGEWHYIHEIIGDLAASGTLEIIAKSGATEELLGHFELGDGQGLTLTDEAGEDNRPRYEFKPGYDAVLRITGGEFNGSLHWSIRN